MLFFVLFLWYELCFFFCFFLWYELCFFFVLFFVLFYVHISGENKLDNIFCCMIFWHFFFAFFCGMNCAFFCAFFCGMNCAYFFICAFFCAGISSGGMNLCKSFVLFFLFVLFSVLFFVA